jgi:glycosyltransferase involved in cell wall biosynthesis
MFDIFRNQDYPKDRIEWIIVDDGSDPIEDIVATSGIPQIKYHRFKEKMSLGKKRNTMHSLISQKTEYVIYFDDDDWYPHDRISHAIDMLEQNPTCMVAGASELYCYFKEIKEGLVGVPPQPAQLFQFGPYGPNHSTAGTFCFRRKLLTITRYDDNKELAEERDFLKEYTIPMIQLNPLKTILVFSHEHNTFDKRTLLVNPHPQFAKPSDKKVTAFFRMDNPLEQKIHRFFMEEIDGLLKDYEPGEPKNKPKVIEQIEVLRAKRETQTTTTQPFGPGGNQVILQQPGKPPHALNAEEIIQLIQGQQQQIEYLTKHSKELERQCELLQMKLV